MRSNRKRPFHPEVGLLEARGLLSTITATLSHGRLVISRDEVSLAIVVDVATPAKNKHGKATLVVDQVASFSFARVKSITINPGPGTGGISVQLPPNRQLPVTITTPTANPSAVTAVTPPAPVAAPLPATTSPPISIPGVTGVESALERQIFDTVNAQRASAGIPVLTLNAKLVTAAQIHSRDMAALGQMEHDLPGVAQPTLISRAQFVGYSYGWLGENIASGFTDVPSLVSAWMNSPEHRANILDANLTDAGIGVGRAADGTLYFTEEFASPATS